jgi:hypothetical protein
MSDMGRVHPVTKGWFLVARLGGLRRQTRGKVGHLSTPKEPVAIFRSTDRSAFEKTLAKPIEQTEYGDNSPSRVATDDCDNIVPKCPQSSLANSRSRPFSDIRCRVRVATKPPLAPCTATRGTIKVLDSEHIQHIVRLTSINALEREQPFSAVALGN